jgi:hypothetical protein
MACSRGCGESPAPKPKRARPPARGQPHPALRRPSRKSHSSRAISADPNRQFTRNRPAVCLEASRTQNKFVEQCGRERAVHDPMSRRYPESCRCVPNGRWKVIACSRAIKAHPARQWRPSLSHDRRDRQGRQQGSRSPAGWFDHIYCSRPLRSPLGSVRKNRPLPPSRSHCRTATGFQAQYGRSFQTAHPASGTGFHPREPCSDPLRASAASIVPLWVIAAACRPTGADGAAGRLTQRRPAQPGNLRFAEVRSTEIFAMNADPHQLDPAPPGLIALTLEKPPAE